MKAIIEFEVEDKIDFLRQWEAANQGGENENWYILDGAYQKIPAAKLLKEEEVQQSE